MRHYEPRPKRVTDSGPGKRKRLISLSEEGRKNWDRIFAPKKEEPQRMYGGYGILGCYPGWVVGDHGDQGRVS